MAITSKILRIADNAAMTNARTVSESSTPNQFDVSELSPDTQYFVEVDVVNARGTSTSAQENFTTEEHIGMEPFNIRNIAQSAATVDWNTGSDNRNLQYSEDKTTWTNVPYANGKYSVTIPVGKKYYFQGSSTNFGGWWGSDEDVEVGGHILSLHYPTMEQPSNQAVSYTRLFSKNNNDTLDGKLHFNFSTLKIPVTRLNGLGAHAMFGGCTSITALNYDIFYTPDGNYVLGNDVFDAMFYNCSSLTRVDGFNVRLFKNFSAWQELAAMFNGCTSLEYVADDFFDTTVTPSTSFFRDKTCRLMFQNCTSLTHPPKLPAARSNGAAFSYMFYGCTSLTSANTANIMPSYTGIGTSGGEYGMSLMFQGMFYGCTGLTSMHNLSSYTMGSGGNSYFMEMYRGCNGITTIETAKMPSGVATQNCFNSMFNGCTSITGVPSGFIKPTNTAESCYQNMFYGCSTISTIPSGLIQATSFTKNCCAGMFQGCSSLSAIPSGFMTVTSVSEGCCLSMFESSGIVSIPSGMLQAQTLATQCYKGMFRSCSRLTTVPSDILLSAKTMASECLTIMFQYDTNINGGLHLGATNIGTTKFAEWWLFDAPVNSIEIDFTEWTTATNGWVVRTAGTGTFIKYESLPEIYDTDHIPVGWTVVNKYISEAPTITHDDTDVIIVNNTYNGGGVIYYTTDGSTPTSASTVYTQPFLGVIGQTIKAICIYHDIISEVASWTVAADALPSPSISGLPDSVTITNNDTTGSSVIYYTTDGTTPTSSSTVYSQPFTVTEGDTVKAVCANATGGHLWLDSDVVSEQIWNRTVISYIYAQTMGNVGDAYSELDKLICTNVTLDNTLKARWWGLGSNYQTACLIGNNGGGNQSYRQRLTMQGGGGWTQAHWINWGVGAYVSFPNNEPLDLTMGNLYIYNNLTSSYLDGGENNAPSPNTGYCYVDIVSRKCAGAQVWKKVNGVETLLFDGVAAVSNGVYGLWDNISHQLFTNTNITVTGE